jgi:signal transduction histidine kinase
MGHNEVGCETRGGVLLDNWPLSRRSRNRSGALLAGPTRGTAPEATAAGAVEATVRRADRALPVLAAGAAALALPFVLHGAVVRAPTLRPALEMMLSLFSLSAASLLRTQFAASRRLRDLLLVCVTLALGLTSLCLNALPAALNVRGGGYLAGAGVVGQLLVAGIFAAAAAAPIEKVVARPEHPIRIGLLLGLTPLAAAASGGLLLHALGVHLGAHTGVSGEAVLIVLVTGTMGFLAYAATTLARENVGRPDSVLSLLAIAALLLAGASLCHLTMRGLPSGEVGVGTAMRVLAAGLLLCAAFVLERRVRSRATRAAALAERRRVARDLHDGIAQDLAFIAAHGEQFAAEMGEEHPVVVAARRALAVSRSTISDLSDPAGATTSEALDAVAHELRDRFDVAIAVHTQIDDPLPSGVREHLSRIAREAIANAARHGQARNVLVSLRQADGGVALRVVDDGCGIAVGERGATPEGFGLRSMRERAGAMGGQLTVRRAPQGGTELEVVLP